MRKTLLFTVLLLIPGALFAQTAAIQNHCFTGGTQAQLSGIGSTNFQQGIVPSCTVTVFLTGTQTLATIFANVGGTPLSNPFTANSSSSVDPGGWIFWAAVNQGYDVVMSGGIAPNTYSQPITLTGAYPSFSFTGGGGAPPSGANNAIQTKNGTSFAGPGPAIDGTTGKMTLFNSAGGTAPGLLANRSDIVDMVADCGLPIDGVTDSTPAINTCFTTFGQGRTYKFPNLTFRQASTPNPIPFGSTVEGTSYSYNDGTVPSSGTILKADVGVTNLITSQNVHISKINVAGSEPTQRLSGQWARQILPVGSCIQFANEAVTMTRASGVVTATSTLQAAYKPNGIVRISGASDTSFNIDTYLDTDTSTGTTETLTWAQPGAPDVVTPVSATLQPATTGTSCSDGILVKGANVVIDHVSSYDHGRSGIRISETGVNDDFSITDSWLFGNRAFGLEVANGDDTNAGTTSHILVYYNQIFGLLDINFLGNKHDSPQASFNHTGGILNPPGSGTFAISTISRTGGVVTVNFSVDTPFAVGLPITIAGVTDSSFNLARATSISGFVNSVSAGGGVNRTVTFNSPIFGQANASSSGGTGAVPDQAHYFLGSAIFGGCYYFGGKFSAANNVLMKPYCEGFQATDNANNSTFINPTVLMTQLHSGDGVDPNWTGSTITAIGSNGNLQLTAPTALQFNANNFHFQPPGSSTDVLTLTLGGSAGSLKTASNVDLISGRAIFASGQAAISLPGTVELQIVSNIQRLQSTNTTATPGRLQLVGRTSTGIDTIYADCQSTGCTFGGVPVTIPQLTVAICTGCGSNIVSVPVALPTTAIGPNACTAPATVSMPGVGVTQTLSITAWQILNNVATFTAANTLVAGQTVTISGFPTSTFFNGTQALVIASGLSGTLFSVNFFHANGSSVEAGTGNATGSAFFWSQTGNPSAITGWGSSGGLMFTPWPTVNTLNWIVCNQTSSSITPGAATLNVGAR